MLFAESFEGVPFDAALDGDGKILPERRVRLSVRPIPLSSSVVIDNGGKDPPTFAFTIFLETAADYDTLWNLLGEVGTLIFQGQTYTALLQSLSQPRIIGSEQFVRTSAEFLLG